MIDASLVFDGTVNSTAPGGVTGAAITTTRVSTNVLDLLAARDMGAGSILGLHVVITEAFTAAGAATLVIDFEVGATAGGTFYNILSSPVLPVASLILGAPVFRYDLPLNQVLNDTNGVLKAPGRYIRLGYTVATGPMTAGKVFSYVNPALDRQSYYTYPNNYVSQ